MAEDTGFFLEDNVAYVPLESIIPAEKVLKRWNLELHQLAQRVKQCEIKAYQLSSSRKNPKTGTNVHICIQLDSMLDGYTCQLNDKCVFDLKDVEAFEAGHPELTWPVVAQAPRPSADENAREHGPEALIAEAATHLRIAQLESDNASLRAENASLREQLKALPGAAAKPPRTAAATKAATEKKAEEWKTWASLMVKVAFDCANEGPMLRTRPQIQTIAKRHGGKFSQTALDLFRDAAPEEHISRTPGPSRQA